MTKKGKNHPKICFRNLEIIRLPQGFLIKINGNTIELKDNETNHLKKALVYAIHEKDFELLQKLLPGSFSAEIIYDYEREKLKGKTVVFISDATDLNSHIKSILGKAPIIQTRYLHYDDEPFFDNDADMIIAHRSLPDNKFFLKLNKFCLDNNIKFIKTTFDDFRFIITPFLLPYESACYNCYILLKKHNHILDGDTLETNDFIYTSYREPSEPMLHFCASFLIVMIFQFLAAAEFDQNDLSEIILDTAKVNILKNPLLKVPFCDVCSLRAKNKK
jgi:hypothetical protein